MTTGLDNESILDQFFGDEGNPPDGFTESESRDDDDLELALQEFNTERQESAPDNDLVAELEGYGLDPEILDRVRRGTLMERDYHKKNQERENQIRELASRAESLARERDFALALANGSAKQTPTTVDQTTQQVAALLPPEKLEALQKRWDPDGTNAEFSKLVADIVQQTVALTSEVLGPKIAPLEAQQKVELYRRSLAEFQESMANQYGPEIRKIFPKLVGLMERENFSRDPATILTQEYPEIALKLLNAQKRRNDGRRRDQANSATLVDSVGPRRPLGSNGAGAKPNGPAKPLTNQELASQILNQMSRRGRKGR